MGQYYKLINLDKGFEVKHDFDKIGGMKLMEHSYLGNELSNFLYNKLASEWRGDRIIHLGDYASETDGTTTQDVIAKLLEEGILEKSGEYGDLIPKNHQIITLENSKDRPNYPYVLNIDKAVYIDITKTLPNDDYYMSVWISKSFKTASVNYLTVDPLLLLVACGNGQGGGDYYESWVNYDEVGSWAGDRIAVFASKEEMETYTQDNMGKVLTELEELNIVFSEEIKYEDLIIQNMVSNAIIYFEKKDGHFERYEGNKSSFKITKINGYSNLNKKIARSLELAGYTVAKTLLK